MNGRAVELALRRQRLIVRSERLRREIGLQGTALERRLARFDQIAAFARRLTSKSAVMTLASTLLYFARSRGSVRVVGRGLVWVSLAKRALNLYRVLVPRRS